MFEYFPSYVLSNKTQEIHFFHSTSDNKVNNLVGAWGPGKRTMQSEDSIRSKKKMAKGESEMNAAIGFSKPSYMYAIEDEGDWSTCTLNSKYIF